MTIAGVRAALDLVVVVSFVLFVAYAVRDVIRAVKKYNAVHERLRRRRRALSDESAQQGRFRA